jgi:hypothetical protein
LAESSTATNKQQKTAALGSLCGLSIIISPPDSPSTAKVADDAWNIRNKQNSFFIRYRPQLQSILARLPFGAAK